MVSWDVVNEAIDGGKEFLRPSAWFKAAGEDYIAEAFAAAHAADPGAELYYNDYDIEQPAKRAKALRLIGDLQARHVPIDGVGIQAHWHLGQVPFQDLEDAIAAFHATGLKVMITELDLDVLPPAGHGPDAARQGIGNPYPQGCPPEVLAQQAREYGELFARFQRHAGEIARVSFRGLHDDRSWLNHQPHARTNYPFLWGRDLQPKPALAAVLDAAR